MAMLLAESFYYAKKSVLTLGAHVQRGLQYFVCVCVCLWEEEKKERVLGIEMAFVRGHMHRCLNTCACLA